MHRLHFTLTLAAALVLFSTSAAPAQSASQSTSSSATSAPHAPIPPAIATARTIFVSNAGADSGLFPSPFSGAPSRGYDDLYADLAASHRFQLVTNPARADLVLELRLYAPYGPIHYNKQYGTSNPLPMFRLVIYDGHTHFILWTLTHSVHFAFLQSTHNHNFDDAIHSLAKQFLNLASPTPATTP